MKTRLGAAALAALVVVMVAGTSGGLARSTASTIGLGALCDLSGPTSDIGVSYCNGEKGYIDWKNRRGGVKGHRITLGAQDFAYNVAKAQQIYSQISAGSAVAILGWGTADTTALVPSITRDKLPFMSASYAEQLTEPKDTPYNFVVATNYSAQAQIAAKYIARTSPGHHEIAFFHNNSAFGTAPIADLQEYIKTKNLNFGFKAYPMITGTTAFDSQLLQARSQGADYIFIQNVPTPASILAKDVKRLGLNAKIVCLNYCGSEVFVKLAGDAANGVLAVQPWTPVSYNVPGDAAPAQWLKNRHRSLANEGLGFLQGWYTMAVMLKGIEKTISDKKDVTGPNIRTSLETMGAFVTGKVTSPIKFSATSHDGMKGSRIYTIKAGKFTKTTGFVVP
jgi:branched-chain amino acid transport system substrate-binding protein